eukprot:TRINITY_DN41802_c0_g2_i2.p1 TRINITY_DN41802_c0_g2~~TRINITY_DN41802_c0_g2_i2.p1  ORF type:complete len:1124 (-),score=281.65 TRINITY_DN41802_c0_g2_i2:273-3644(-)
MGIASQLAELLAETGAQQTSSALPRPCWTSPRGVAEETPETSGLPQAAPSKVFGPPTTLPWLSLPMTPAQGEKRPSLEKRHSARSLKPAELLEAERFDNFDLARWRNECEADMREALAASRPSTGVVLSARHSGAKAGTAGGLVSARLQPLADGTLQQFHKAVKRIQQQRGQDLPREERVQISEAVFCRHDPQLLGICRGNIASFMEARDRFHAEHARRERDCHYHVGNEHRLLAAEWRQRRTTDLASAGDADTHGSADGPTNEVFRPQRLRRNDKAAAALSRGRRGAKALLGDVSQDDGFKSLIENYDMNKYLKETIMQTSKHKRKLKKMRLKKREQLIEFPEYDRRAIQSAFAVYSADGTHVKASNLLRCLMELGLGGQTSEERCSVDRVCSYIYSTLVQEYVKFGLIEPKPKKAEPSVDILDDAASGKADARRRAVLSLLSDRPNKAPSPKPGAEDFSGTTFQRSVSEDAPATANIPEVSMEAPSGVRRQRTLGKAATIAFADEDDDKGAGPAYGRRRMTRIGDLQDKQQQGRKSVVPQPKSTFTARLSTGARKTVVAPRRSFVSSRKELADRLTRGKGQGTGQGQRFFSKKASDGTLPVEAEDSVAGTPTIIPVRSREHRKAFTFETGDHEIDITLEDFAVEVVPAIRQQLDSSRMDAHMLDYMQNIDKKGEQNAGIPSIGPPGLMRLVSHLGIGPAIITETMRESFPEMLRAWESKHAADDPDHNGQMLDFDVVHDILLQAEERVSRMQRAKERSIKERWRISDKMFWKWRSELIHLSDMFHLFDADESGILSRDELRVLLKQLGLNPYRKQEAALIDGLLKDTSKAGLDGANEEVNFIEFLSMMESLRAHQLAARQKQLSQTFKKRARHNRIDLKETLSLLKEIGPDGTEKEDKAKDDMDDSTRLILKNLINDYDTAIPGELVFVEVEELVQLALERLQCLDMERIQLEASRLHISQHQLHEYQCVFDQLDADGSGGLSVEEITEGLEMLMGRPPTQLEIVAIYRDTGNDMAEELNVLEFLQLFKQAQKSGLFGEEDTFMLIQLPEQKLREVLRAFKLASRYVDDLDHQMLVSLAADYLGISPTEDLKQMLGAETINQMRAFTDFVRQKAGVPSAHH